MKKKLLGIAAAGLLMSQASIAGLYGSASYAFFETEVVGVDFDTPTVQFALGNAFNEHFSGEIRLGLGVDEDDSFGLDLEISKYVALYLKPTLPLADNISVYALLGFAETEIDTSVGDDTDSDMSFGFGLTGTLENGIHLFAEYINLYDESEDGIDVEITGFNIGMGFDF